MSTTATQIAQRVDDPPVWIDSHCHIHDERIPDGPDGAVAAAADMGVHTLVTVGCDRATSLAAIDVASRHDNVFATVGLHPHDAVNGIDTILDLAADYAPSRVTDDATSPAAIGEADSPSGKKPIVAIGEAGLDYYYEHSERDVQKTAFAAQIQLAHELALPLVIHSRDAWDDTFDVLDAEGVPERTIFHCFTGGPDEARRCLERGTVLSFSGIVTFPSAADVQEAALLCPLDSMLVETDSPYLAPVPQRGKKNRPAWVPHVGEFIAQLRQISVAEVAAATAANTRRTLPGIA